MEDNNHSASHSFTNIIKQTENMTPKQIKILEAAIELIAEKGYAATSTSEIAKRAGVAEGTIFRHYQTKKDLLMAIVHPVIAQFMIPTFAGKFVDEVFHHHHTSLQNFLYLLIKNRFSFVKDNVPLIKILIQELAFHPELQDALKKTALEKVIPAMQQTFDFYKEKGELRDIPNDQIIRMIGPAIIGFLFTRFIIQPDRAWDDEMEIKQTIDYLMHGIGK